MTYNSPTAWQKWLAPSLRRQRPRPLKFENLEARQMLSASTADFDNDNAVDGDDLTVWTSGLGTINVATDQGDADQDGDVDGNDFLIWQRQVGTTFESPSDVYFVGNSLTGGLRLTEALRPFVNAQGHELSEGLGRNDFAQIVAGASLSWHWHQKKVNTDPAEFYIDDFSPELTNSTWDTLVLQPFNQALYSFNTNPYPDLPKFETWKPRPREEGVVQMANNFIELAAHHDDLRVVIYQSWPSIPSLPGTNLPDYDAFDYKTEWDDDTNSSVRSRDDYAELIDTLRQRWGGTLNPLVVTVPTGDVLYELNERLKAQPFTDVDQRIYDDVEDFYGDRIHLNTGNGRYLMALTMYSVLYNEDPRGLPIGNYNDIDIYNLGFQSSFAEISEPMQQFLQNLVWDVITNHPYTGFSPSAAANANVTPNSALESSSTAMSLSGISQGLIPLSASKNAQHGIRTSPFSAANESAFVATNVEHLSLASLNTHSKSDDGTFNEPKEADQRSADWIDLAFNDFYWSQLQL